MINGRYYIQTYGCQMNEHDSETISGLLDAHGYQETSDLEAADIILLNTCCIREKAEHKVLSQLGEMKRLIESQPNRIIGVVGCMVQQRDIVPRILKAAPFVKLLSGTNNIHEIPRVIERIFATGERLVVIDEDSPPLETRSHAKRRYPFRAYVNIIYGCNNFCSYCVVPHVRGRERSRAMEDVIAEVRQLVQEGVVEITLLGQNVNSYGNDLGESNLFPRLLKELDQIRGLKRIRFMTSHPKDLSDVLIQTIRDSAHVCPSIHLPVQSGSDGILKKMNRKYTRAHYLERLETIRREIPKAAITTDIIVGFPGETDEDFQATMDLVEEAQFDSAFSFIYSRRPGTLAATMQELAVPLTLKKERLAKLNARLAHWGYENNKEYAGRVVKVLVDGVSKTSSLVLNGRTDTGKTVLFEGPESWIGTFVDVRIDETQTWVMKGHQVEMEEENEHI